MGAASGESSAIVQLSLEGPVSNPTWAEQHADDLIAGETVRRRQQITRMVVEREWYVPWKVRVFQRTTSLADLSCVTPLVRCAATGLYIPRCDMRAAHIMPVADCRIGDTDQYSNDQKNPDNGLPLAVQLDKMFEGVYRKAVISFGDNGHLLYDRDLHSDTIELIRRLMRTRLGLDKDILTKGTRKHLHWHRENAFPAWKEERYALLSRK